MMLWLPVPLDDVECVFQLFKVVATDVSNRDLISGRLERPEAIAARIEK